MFPIVSASILIVDFMQRLQIDVLYFKIRKRK